MWIIFIRSKSNLKYYRMYAKLKITKISKELHFKVDEPSKILCHHARSLYSIKFS